MQVLLYFEIHCLFILRLGRRLTEKIISYWYDINLIRSSTWQNHKLIPSACLAKNTRDCRAVFSAIIKHLGDILLVSSNIFFKSHKKRNLVIIILEGTLVENDGNRYLVFFSSQSLFSLRKSDEKHNAVSFPPWKSKIP